MFQPRLCVVLPAADRAQLTDVAASGKTPQKIAIRAQLLVWLADRVGPADIARRLRISRNHVHDWVQRYVAQGVSGVLTDAPRPGRRTRLTPERVAASSSWLNLVERWFGELTAKKIKRGSHLSVRALEADIRDWIEVWNEDPKPYVWTKTADQILESLAAYCQQINKLAN